MSRDEPVREPKINAQARLELFFFFGLNKLGKKIGARLELSARPYRVEPNQLDFFFPLHDCLQLPFKGSSHAAYIIIFYFLFFKF